MRGFNYLLIDLNPFIKPIIMNSIIFSKMINKVVLGDAVKIMKNIPDNSIDLVFADPPYNIGIKYDNYKDKLPQKDYIKWTDKWFDEVTRVLKQTGSLYVAINDENAAEFVAMLKNIC